MSNSWRDAFLRQARSDFDVANELRRRGRAPCHWIHYLQMATEKLAKAYLISDQGGPPPRSHASFVRFVRVVGSRSPAIASRYRNRGAQLKAYLRGLEPIAQAIENLAPAIAQDGPNPEYPWSHRTGIVAPIDYDFSEFSPTRGSRVAKLLRFVEVCLQTAA